MKAGLIILAAGLAAAPAAAQHAGHHMPPATPVGPPAAEDSRAGHGAHGMHPMPPSPAPAAAPEAPPEAMLAGPRHAADRVFDPAAMAAAREQLRAEQGGMTAYKVMVDRLEARLDGSSDRYLWDAEGWYGGDIDRLWIKSEGEGGFDEKLDEVEFQVLWSHAVTPWFDTQAGVRYDVRPQPERAHLVLGLQGLAPYRVEIDVAAFLSEDGDLSARAEAEYDVRVTQRLVLQPRAEIELAAQEVPDLGIGSGITVLSLGLRLRYEFARELAPYVGVSWDQKLGETADFARDDGDSVDDLYVVAGLRIWF